MIEHLHLTEILKKINADPATFIDLNSLLQSAHVAPGILQNHSKELVN